MKIYLASDHAGFELKNKIKAFLEHQSHKVEDCGAFSYEPTDDYPDFIAKAAEAVSKNPEDRAIIFGGSGQGEAMVANRYKNVRAAVFYSPAIALVTAGAQSLDPYEIIKLSREHNNANILSLGARFISEADAFKAVELFLNTPFSDDERHNLRISKF